MIIFIKKLNELLVKLIYFIYGISLPSKMHFNVISSQQVSNYAIYICYFCLSLGNSKTILLDAGVLFPIIDIG